MHAALSGQAALNLARNSAAAPSLLKSGVLPLWATEQIPQAVIEYADEWISRDSVPERPT